MHHLSTPSQQNLPSIYISLYVCVHLCLVLIICLGISLDQGVSSTALFRKGFVSYSGTTVKCSVPFLEQDPFFFFISA